MSLLKRPTGDVRPPEANVHGSGRPADAPTEGDVETTPVLEAVHLRKVFPLGGRLFGPARGVHAVEDFSLTLYPGRATALVGESGSGKTTVARMLAHLYAPTSGTIHFAGKPVDLRRPSAVRAYRRQVQMIFQDPFSSLNPVHTVRYHLERPLRLFGHARSRADVTERALDLLRRVNLEPADQFIVKFPHELSGGQRQRVAIARALAVQPSVLLADEPVSMLDVSIRLDILNLLLRLKADERLALLYITHDIASARYFADDTLVMYAGQLVEGGPSEAVTQDPKHPYTQLLLSAAPDPDRIAGAGHPVANASAASAYSSPQPVGASGGRPLSASGGRPLSASGGRPPAAPEDAAPYPARGEIPSLISPPSGCRFHPRCPHAMPVCRERFPGRTDLGGGRWVNCFLYGEGDSASASAPTTPAPNGS